MKKNKHKHYDKHFHFYYERRYTVDIYIRNTTTVCYVEDSISGIRAKSKMKLREGDVFDEQWVKMVIVNITLNKVLQKYKNEIEEVLEICNNQMNDYGIKAVQLIEEKYPDYYNYKK